MQKPEINTDIELMFCERNDGVGAGVLRSFGQRSVRLGNETTGVTLIATLASLVCSVT